MPSFWQPPRAPPQNSGGGVGGGDFCLCCPNKMAFVDKVRRTSHVLAYIKLININRRRSLGGARRGHHVCRGQQMPFWGNGFIADIRQRQQISKLVIFINLTPVCWNDFPIAEQEERISKTLSNLGGRNNKLPPGP